MLAEPAYTGQHPFLGDGTPAASGVMILEYSAASALAELRALATPAGIQVVNNPRRLQKVLYRAPGGKAWEVKTWAWAMDRIAVRVKETRDKTFKTAVDGRVVNRTEGIACLGGSALDNEEAYLLAKLMRALGLVYVEHQARL